MHCQFGVLHFDKPILIDYRNSWIGGSDNTVTPQVWSCFSPYKVTFLLPIVYLIQYRSNCAMYHHYTNNVIPLFPPVMLGHQHECDTHHPVHFANLPRCRLSSTQHFFRTRGPKWGNLLPSDVVSLGYSTFSSVVYDSLMRQYNL